MGTLSGTERKMLCDRREHLLVLRTGSALLGSWIGLALVFTVLPRVIAQVRSARDSPWVAAPDASHSKADTPARAVVREATDTAAVRSRLGKAMRGMLDEVSPRGWAKRPQFVAKIG
jgi:hypothetical protein